jgi:hypothetical protein
MFDIFDNLLMFQEIEFEGKTYLRLSTLRGGLVTAVEKDAEMPAPVVVIKDPAYKAPKEQQEEGS